MLGSPSDLEPATDANVDAADLMASL
jgi:hypothetical protein